MHAGTIPASIRRPIDVLWMFSGVMFNGRADLGSNV